jgi:hypothetical protein
MAGECRIMNPFEIDIRKNAVEAVESQVSLFVQLASTDESQRQRALVRNVFLNRRESDPTPTPYDSIPRNMEAPVPAADQCIRNPNYLAAKSYYDGKTSTLFYNPGSDKNRV